jgi:hypothetical protein
MTFALYDYRLNRLRDPMTGRFVAFNPAPDEVCPNGCERFGDWWVPEDCPTHLGSAS